MPDFYQPYFVIGILFLTFLFIYMNLIKPAIGFLIAVLLFAITGILNTEEVLAGFSNSSIVVIILLVVITAGLRKNFRLEFIFDAVFKKSKTYRNFLFRMMTQVAILSSFINNTPVVALMTPYVFDYGRKNNIAPSKLLIPLSFATIMGGMLTLIGTSTTLVLNGFIIEANKPELQIMDLLIIGALVTVSGILFIVTIGHKLLPNHIDTIKSFTKNQREYLVELRLKSDSAIINKTIIEAEDILFFAGDTNNIMDLINIGKGLILPEKASEYHQDQIEVIEAVIANFSSIVGKTVKEANFRNRYDAAIIAIHRNGERISGKIGDIELKPSDVLLLYAGHDFNNRVDLYRDLYVINKVRQIAEPGNKKYYALALILLGSLVLLITKGLELFPSLLIIFSMMAGFKLITVQDVRRELDFNMIGILVLSLAVGQAMIRSGAGELAAGWMIDIFAPMGRTSILIGLIIVTNILTALIGNVGAVSIAFPIALGISTSLHISGMPLYLGIAYGASAAFITPFSYQTNLIIYGPGGYNLRDFARIGFPVTLIYLGITFAAILLLYNDVFIN